MKRISLILPLLLLAAAAVAGRGDTWQATMKKYYRSATGNNEARISIRLVKCSGRSSLLDGELCGRTANGATVCTEIDTGKRMEQGQSVSLWVKFPRTKYPIERVFLKN